MKMRFHVFLSWVCLLPWFAARLVQATELPQLQVSENGRFFVTDEGTPFFWLGDTAWFLFEKLNREDADFYLSDRKSKGFTVIQAVVLWHLKPNAYGHKPLVKKNDKRIPNELYFKHVDYIVDTAERKGLYIGILPAWAGSLVRKDRGLFNTSNTEEAYAYGLFLGARYRNKPIIWILGGDYYAEGADEVWRELARGLSEGDDDRHLITYHPRGGRGSSTRFHNEQWLDFNMIQSSHSKQNHGYDAIARDYSLKPAKPTIDGEANYENITDGLRAAGPGVPLLNAADVRRAAYCDVFAGAAGHTYGCNEIYQFWTEGKPDARWGAILPWKKALDLPGAGHMQFLRKLIESRPMLIRIPDQSLIAGDPMKRMDRMQATRGSDGGYAFIYISSDKPVRIQMDKISGDVVKASWYDPRTGTSKVIGRFPSEGIQSFVPPSSGNDNDWVLVMDAVVQESEPERKQQSTNPRTSFHVDFSGSDDASLRPHIPRQGENLVSNPTVQTTSTWALLGNATYDIKTSRTSDGSGSFSLITPYYDKDRKHQKNAGRVHSAFIPVQGGMKYTLGFFVKTANGPTYVSTGVGTYDGNKKFIRNISSIRSGTSEDGKWQECAMPVFVPKEAVFVRVAATKMADTRDGGRVWVDDFYFGEGVGLEHSPTAKQAFDGARVRVDGLGNFEIKKGSKWTPFFPLCMYSDGYRDPMVYSKQGWNTLIWMSSASGVRRAKEAVSSFNPDGMMAGFQISPYTFPSWWAYNDLEELRTKLGEIFSEGLGDQLLLYYWDNENNYSEWQVPVNIINTIKSIDTDSSGRRLHPIYALQGNYGIARVHAAHGLVDISGTYVGGGADAVGNAGTADFDGLFILDRLEQQMSPASFAQFNGVNGAGDMRLRLYSSIILGAKAMGYWRDCYKGCSERFQKSVGPVNKKPWWPDFPNLRREVDQLLPLIRQPHWTSWKVKIDAQGVRVGTRSRKGEAYLILVNQTSRRQNITLTLSGLLYSTKEVRDYFNDKKVATVSDNSFSLVLPGIDVGSGTMVLRVVPLSDAG
jgi:hypothetical protein